MIYEFYICQFEFFVYLLNLIKSFIINKSCFDALIHYIDEFF